jgi:hypothetical protein
MSLFVIEHRPHFFQQIMFRILREQHQTNDNISSHKILKH